MVDYATRYRSQCRYALSQRGSQRRLFQLISRIGFPKEIQQIKVPRLCHLHYKSMQRKSIIGEDAADLGPEVLQWSVEMAESRELQQHFLLPAGLPQTYWTPHWDIPHMTFRVAALYVT